MRVDPSVEKSFAPNRYARAHWAAARHWWELVEKKGEDSKIGVTTQPLKQRKQDSMESAIAGEITEYLGRPLYQHCTEFKGYRNGYQQTKLDTPLGVVEYDRPKLAGAPAFKSRYHTPHMRRPEEFAQAVTDMYVNGTSTRKVKATLKAVSGERTRLSK